MLDPFTIGSVFNGNLLLVRMPNRYRKMMKNLEIEKDLRDEWGCDYTLEELNPSVILKQQEEFETDWTPIGIQSNEDNDWYIAWEK